MTAVSAPSTGFSSILRLRSVFLALAGIAFGALLGLMFIAAFAVQFLDYQLVRVQTGSMQPAYNQGDLVIVRPTAPIDVESGDVILFTANTGSSVMHRVIGINTIESIVRDGETGATLETNTRKQFITQGDANVAADVNPVDGANVHGVVWFKIPGLGGADDLTLQTFLLIAAGMIAVAWISYEGYKFTGRRGEKKSEQTTETSTAEGTPPPADDET